MKSKLRLGLLLLCVLWMTSCDDSGTDGTNVAEPNVADRVGEVCDSKTFETICKGDNLLYCGKDIIKIVNCAELKTSDGKARTCAQFAQPVNAETCDDEDEECINSSSSTVDDIDCISSADACSVENDVQVRCVKAAAGYTYLWSYRCEKAKDGRLFYRQVSKEDCYDKYGVCSSDGKCQEPVYCEDGYEAHCDGNILKKCNKNRLLTSDCTSYSNPHVCSVIDETPKCLSSANECTIEGEEIVKSCNAKTGKELISVCTRAENGKLYYQLSGTRQCLNGCADDGNLCKSAACTEIGATQEKCRIQGTYVTYVDTYTCTEKGGAKVFVLSSSDKCDEGRGTCSNVGQCVPAEDCETKSFVSKCENGVAVNCTGKKVRYKHCELSSTSPYCAVVDGKASCYSDADMCSKEGEEIVARCNVKTNKESLRKCTKGSDNNLYYVSSGSRECPNGCNSEGTKCN